MVVGEGLHELNERGPHLRPVLATVDRHDDHHGAEIIGLGIASDEKPISVTKELAHDQVTGTVGVSIDQGRSLMVLSFSDGVRSPKHQAPLAVIDVFEHHKARRSPGISGPAGRATGDGGGEHARRNPSPTSDSQTDRRRRGSRPGSLIPSAEIDTTGARYKSNEAYFRANPKSHSLKLAATGRGPVRRLPS